MRYVPALSLRGEGTFGTCPGGRSTACKVLHPIHLIAEAECRALGISQGIRTNLIGFAIQFWLGFQGISYLGREPIWR